MTLSELIIKITADTSGAISGINETEKKVSKLSGIAGKLGAGMKTAGKLAAGAVAAGAAAVAGLAASAVKAYAQYEQLVGGVETLFKESADIVKKYAQDAYKTAGIDANKYMETVTSFSASLLQSLGGDTKKAAEVAHMAMVDMSDNANKMGTDMASIMTAYQGFAKQNYTMLDNLKLGYGGTRKEMQRLLKDAEKLTGKKYDINNLNDVYEAIHAIQTELGITGTTAKEAETTIQGSFNQMKSAWENLKIAMVDPNGNVGQALENLINSAKTFGKNIIPAISDSLKGIGSVIKELAPVISAELPGLVSDIMPNLIDGAVSLVSGLSTAIVENAPMIIDGFGQVFQSAGEAMKQSDNPIFNAMGHVLTFLGDLIRDPKGTLIGAWESVKTFAAGVWEKVSEWFNTTFEPVITWTQNAWETVSTAFTNAKAWVKEKYEAAVTWAQNAWEDVSSAFATAGEWAGKAFNVTIKWLQNAWSTILNAFTKAGTWVGRTWHTTVEWIQNAWSYVSDAFDKAKEWVGKTWQTTVEWIQNAWGTVSSAFDKAGEWVEKTWKTTVEWVQNSWKTITDAFDTAKEWVNKAFKVTINFVKGLWQDVMNFISSIPRQIEVWVDVKRRGDATAAEIEAGLGGAPIPRVPVKTLVQKLFGRAKGDWNVPYDMPAMLHRNEMVLTASQARRYRDGEDSHSMDMSALANTIVSAVREGMAGASVNSFLDGQNVTDEISRIVGEAMTARRFA